MTTTAALVGIGGYGQYYLAEIFGAAGRDFQLVAGIDPVPESCRMLTVLQDAGIPVYPTLDAFFANGTADLVIIAAPIHQHARLTELALSRGAYVLCEKPLAGSWEDARKMQEAERAAEKPVAIGYQWSFSDAILNLKRDILAGRLGKPLSAKTITLWPRARSYFQRNDWAGKIRASDGTMVLDSPVNNATAHYLHNMLFLLGDTLETSARPASLETRLYRANEIENYDTAALRIQTAGGAKVLFFTTHAVIEEQGPLVEMAFEHAVVIYPNADFTFQARYHDGRVVDYGNPNDTAGNKLWTTVDIMRNGGILPCGIETALPHLDCVVQAQENPIRDFPEEKIRQTEIGETDIITWVEGLAEEMMDCYLRGELLP